MYLVNECFTSINGEGLKAGQMADFIRMSGCPLRCSYCDTTYAQSKNAGRTMPLSELLAFLQSSPAQNLTLTGGEPLAQEGVLTLVQHILKHTTKNIEIETSGSIAIEPFLKLREERRLSFTLDFKLPSSGMSSEMVLENYRKLKSFDVVKYVVSGKEDLQVVKSHFLDMAKHYTSAHMPRAILSPAYGKIEASALVNWLMDQAKASDRFAHMGVQLQLHKYIWNPNERGV